MIPVVRRRKGFHISLFRANAVNEEAAEQQRRKHPPSQLGRHLHLHVCACVVCARLVLFFLLFPAPLFFFGSHSRLFFRCLRCPKLEQVLLRLWRKDSDRESARARERESEREREQERERTRERERERTREREGQTRGKEKKVSFSEFVAQEVYRRTSSGHVSHYHIITSSSVQEGQIEDTCHIITSSHYHITHIGERTPHMCGMRDGCAVCGMCDRVYCICDGYALQCPTPSPCPHALCAGALLLCAPLLAYSLLARWRVAQTCSQVQTLTR